MTRNDSNDNVTTDDAHLRELLRINHEISPPSRIYCDEENPYLNDQLAKRVASGDLRIHFNENNTSFFYKGCNIFAQYIGAFLNKDAYIAYIRSLAPAPIVEVSYDYIPYNGRLEPCTYVFINWQKRKSICARDSLVFHGFLPRIYSLKSTKVGRDIMRVLYAIDPESFISPDFDDASGYAKTVEEFRKIKFLNPPKRKYLKPKKMSEEQKSEIAKNTAMEVLETITLTELTKNTEPAGPGLINFNKNYDNLFPQFDPLILSPPQPEDIEKATMMVAITPDLILNKYDMKMAAKTHVARPNRTKETAKRDRVFREMTDMCSDLLRSIDKLFSIDTKDKIDFCQKILMAVFAKQKGELTPEKLEALKTDLLETHNVREVVFSDEFNSTFESQTETTFQKDMEAIRNGPVNAKKEGKQAPRDKLYEEMNKLCPKLLQAIDLLYALDTKAKGDFCIKLLSAVCRKRGNSLTPPMYEELKKSLTQEHAVGAVLDLPEFKETFETKKPQYEEDDDDTYPSKPKPDPKPSLKRACKDDDEEEEEYDGEAD